MSNLDKIKARIMRSRDPSRPTLELVYPHSVDAARWDTVFTWNEDLAAEGGYVMTADAALWLVDNLEVGSYVVKGSTVLFNNENDAFAFKLRWG